MTRFIALTLAVMLAVPAAAQVGKSQGVVDANTIAEADLTKLPDAGDREGAGGGAAV
jgi:hypothetical protein